MKTTVSRGISRHSAKRREPRHRVEDYVAQVVLADPPTCFEARIMDISGTGLRFRAPTLLEVGRAISIIFNSVIVEGKIRYCVDNEIGTLDVGVQIGLVHDRPLGPLEA